MGHRVATVPHCASHLCVSCTGTTVCALVVEMTLALLVGQIHSSICLLKFRCRTSKLFRKGIITNPMTRSQNCTFQQSSVNLLDQRNTSVEQDASHNCWAYDALPCMSEIVSYQSAGGEFASCLQAIAAWESEAELRSRLAKKRCQPQLQAQSM